jgi:hypothetical protein
MPLPSGEAIEEFVERWFEEKGIELRCAACHRSCWRPSQYAAVPWVSAEGSCCPNEEGLPLFYQLLPLACGHCGFVVFFNALTMSGEGKSYYPERVTEAGDPRRPM